MLDSQASFAPFLDAASSAADPALAGTPAPATAPRITAQPSPDPFIGTDPRPVTPRRPLRFSFARNAEDVAPVTLPVSNIFAGIFDEDDLSTAGVDPRLARSRHRARAILAAREASLPAEEANLWHDFGIDDAKIAAPAPPNPAAATRNPDATTGTHGRRPVRHLGSADLPAHRPIGPPVERPVELPAHDPLQDHLHRIRAALYAPDPESKAATQPSLPARLAAHTLNMALVATALPVGVAMMIYTFLRGEDLRLSARMVAVAGTALAILQLGLDPLA